MRATARVRASGWSCWRSGGATLAGRALPRTEIVEEAPPNPQKNWAQRHDLAEPRRPARARAQRRYWLRKPGPGRSGRSAGNRQRTGPEKITQIGRVDQTRPLSKVWGRSCWALFRFSTTQRRRMPARLPSPVRRRLPYRTPRRVRPKPPRCQPPHTPAGRLGTRPRPPSSLLLRSPGSIQLGSALIGLASRIGAGNPRFRIGQPGLRAMGPSSYK